LHALNPNAMNTNKSSLLNFIFERFVVISFVLYW
jgi:hypothetical protein